MKRLTIGFIMGLLLSSIFVVTTHEIFSTNPCVMVKKYAEKQDAVSAILWQNAQKAISAVPVNTTITSADPKKAAVLFLKNYYSQTLYADSNSSCYPPRVIATLKGLQSAYFQALLKWETLPPEQETPGMISPFYNKYASMKYLLF